MQQPRLAMMRCWSAVVPAVSPMVRALKGSVGSPWFVAWPSVDIRRIKVKCEALESSGQIRVCSLGATITG